MNTFLISKKFCFSAFLYLLIFDTYASNIIELRCNYEYRGTSTEKEIWRDNNGIKTYEKKPVESTDNGKGVDFVKITIDDDYLKFEDGSKKFIFSTRDSENKFYDWTRSDITMKITNKSDVNRIFISADILITKYGEKNIFEKISIDRVTGEFEKTVESDSNLGKIDKDKPININERNFSFYTYKGVCEKFRRKF